MLSSLFLLVGAATYSVASPSEAVRNMMNPAEVVLPRASRCVDGVPASLPTDGGWEIDYAAVTIDPVMLSHYNVESNWYKEHYISTMSISMGPGNDLYGAFKCQFACNGAESDCVSYFGKYVEIGPGSQSYECSLFNELLDSSLFVSDDASVPAGGYNKLCNPPTGGL